MAMPRKTVAMMAAEEQNRRALDLAVRAWEKQQEAQDAAVVLQAVGRPGQMTAQASGDRQARIQAERQRIAALSPEDRQREYDAYLARKQQAQQQQALDAQYLGQRDAVRPDPIMGGENNVERWMPQPSQRGVGAGRTGSAKVRTI